jgi:tetratricopeptide (TPR) repeat protein
MAGPGNNMCSKFTDAEFEVMIKAYEKRLAIDRVLDDLNGQILNLAAIADLQCHIGKLYESVHTYIDLLDKCRSKCCSRPNVENYEYTADIHEEAITLFKETHQHDLVIKTMLNHAQFLSKLKKYDQAISIFKQVSNCGNSRLTGKANVELNKIFQKTMFKPDVPDPGVLKSPSGTSKKTKKKVQKVHLDLGPGLSYSFENEYRSALEEFLKISMVNKSFEDKCVIYCNIARCHFHLEQYQKAIQVCWNHLDLLKTTKSNVIGVKIEILSKLTHSYFEDGYYKECIEYSKELLKILDVVLDDGASAEDDTDPNSFTQLELKMDTLFNSASAFIHLGLNAQAVDYAEKGLNIVSSRSSDKIFISHASYDILGRAYFGLKNYSKAIENFTQSLDMIKYNPSMVLEITENMVKLGLCFKKLGQPDEAMDVLFPAVEMKKRYYRLKNVFMDWECRMVFYPDLCSLYLIVGACYYDSNNMSNCHFYFHKVLQMCIPQDRDRTLGRLNEVFKKLVLNPEDIEIFCSKITDTINEFPNLRQLLPKEFFKDLKKFKNVKGINRHFKY